MRLTTSLARRAAPVARGTAVARRTGVRRAVADHAREPSEAVALREIDDERSVSSRHDPTHLSAHLGACVEVGHAGRNDVRAGPNRAVVGEPRDARPTLARRDLRAVVIVAVGAVRLTARHAALLGNRRPEPQGQRSLRPSFSSSSFSPPRTARSPRLTRASLREPPATLRRPFKRRTGRLGRCSCGPWCAPGQRVPQCSTAWNARIA